MVGRHASSVNRSSAGSARIPLLVNPLLDVFNRAMATSGDNQDTRTAMIARYGFAIPTDDALDAIMQCSPAGVVEIGAGTGYWAHLLAQRGIDVVAFDIEPAPSQDNAWFAGTTPWHPVHRGDHHVVGRHPDRTLLLVWPTKNEIWPAEAITQHHNAGGTYLVYVGEGPGGRTGDDVFQALLGELTTCTQCEHESVTSPCICGVAALWQRIETIPLPHWPGYRDDLHVYTRQALKTRPRRWPQPPKPRTDPR